MYQAELAVRQGDLGSAAEWLTHNGMQVDKAYRFSADSTF